MKKTLPIFFALVVSFTAACQRADADDEGGATPEIDATVETVSSETFVESIGALGMVVGRPGGTAKLSTPIPARVASVQVMPGQLVHRGAVLVTLDQTAFAGATGAAQASLATAQRTFERTKRLVEEGIAPRKDLDQAEADLARARAEQSVALRSQQLSVLRSPINGIVTNVAATLGATADPSQSLVEIADPSLLDIAFNVTSAQASRIRAGDKVVLSTSQEGAIDTLGIAVVMDISGAVDTLSHAVSVRAHAPATKRPLRLSETVFGQIAISVHPNAVVVPLTALVPEGDGFKVFVVDQKMVAHSRPVTVGGRNSSVAEILGGLRAGEKVVTVGAYGVDDSAKISVHAADSAAGGE
jgi:RND family efflux transporter MFP subunit